MTVLFPLNITVRNLQWYTLNVLGEIAVMWALCVHVVICMDVVHARMVSI